MMKLIIKSKQDYGTHIEEYKEDFSCTLKEENEKIIVEFSQGKITIEKNRIIQERNNNKIIIEAGKTYECDYVTEYGKLTLKIKGLNIEQEKRTNEFYAKAKYEIFMKSVAPYVNEVALRVIEL